MKRPFAFDPWLLILIIALTLIGAVAIQSGHTDALIKIQPKGALATYKPAINHLMFALIGIVAMAVIARTPFNSWRKLASGFLIVTVALNLLPAFGLFTVEKNEAARWVQLPFLPFQFQPSEILKFATIVLFAVALEAFAHKRLAPKHYLYSGIWLVGLAAVAIFQRDFGTAFVILLLAATVSWMGGIRMTYFAAAVAVFVVLLGVYFHTGDEFRKIRILAWLNPAYSAQGVNYQPNRAVDAIVSGGLFGKGVGSGQEKRNYSETSTDFVFATIAEETGLFGGLVVLSLLGALWWRLRHIASKADREFARLAIYGAAAWIGYQTLLNVAMVTRLLPTVGIPLPFISMGGTNLVLIIALMGFAHRSANRTLPENDR